MLQQSDISIIMGPANEHDSTRFVDVMEGVHDFLDIKMVAEIESVYADKGYDSESIRRYLEDNCITACIPHRRFGKSKSRGKRYTSYYRVRYVVERFFSWLKNGYRKTGIRYKRELSWVCASGGNCDVLEDFRMSYLLFVTELKGF